MAKFQHGISQHCWPSICKIRQTIVTFECNMSQHCWVLKIKLMCMVGATLLCKPSQTTTTSWKINKINAAWKIWPFSNLSQKHPTCCNMSWQVTKLAVTNKICCVEMLQSFGQGFSFKNIWIKQLSYWLQRFLLSFSGYWPFRTNKKPSTFFDWSVYGNNNNNKVSNCICWWICIYYY